MHIMVDGTAVAAVPGQSVASALMAAGVLLLRRSRRDGAPRGAFCLSGVCQECIVRIDDAAVLACQVPVRPALAVALDSA